MKQNSFPEGFRFLPGYLDREAQENLLDEIREGLRDSPLFQPVMPRTGKPMSVKMSSFGSFGWYTDQKGGYRYEPRHPRTGRDWPAIPGSLLKLWDDLAGYPAPPESCLINFYEPDARMGLHQDADEQDKNAPVLSISLGDTALFRIGGPNRRDRTQSIRLESGDIVILDGTARHCFHGIDKIYPDTNTLLKTSGRVNITMRRVQKPA